MSIDVPIASSALVVSTLCLRELDTYHCEWHRPKEKTLKDVKTTPKKVYYLFCSLCRWTSRDAGISDQSVGRFNMLVILN